MTCRVVLGVSIYGAAKVVVAVKVAPPNAVLVETQSLRVIHLQSKSKNKTQGPQ